MIQWACHGGPNQPWRLEPAGGGAFHLVARHSGKALDVGGANQQWLLRAVPSTAGAVSTLSVR